MKALAAAFLIMAQAMPVTRLAGGASETTLPQAAPRRPPVAGLPVTQLEPEAASLDSRRLSLTFGEPRPIEEVLRLVVAGTPFSLAVDRDVTGVFRGDLKQLTVRQALTTLLSPLGCEFDVRGTVIRVTRVRTQTREFDVNVLAVQRGLSRTSGISGAEVTTATATEDVFAGISEGVRVLLSPNGSLHIDRRAGLVQATDYPDRLDRVAQYLEALRVRSGREVRLQARVLEVTLNENAPAIDWDAVRSKLGQASDAPRAGLAADPAALQGALAEQGDIRVLLTPEVTALNNEPALVRASVPGGSSLTLSVVPQIASDGVVQLSVSHAWEELAAGHERLAEADTVTRVRTGDMVLLAGWLRPAPVASASSGQSATPGQAELVVLLRATVVVPGTR
jgi:type II secretory pathway component GspD/PulD (secretin)